MATSASRLRHYDAKTSDRFSTQKSEPKTTGQTPPPFERRSAELAATARDSLVELKQDGAANQSHRLPAAQPHDADEQQAKWLPPCIVLLQRSAEEVAATRPAFSEKLRELIKRMIADGPCVACSPRQPTPCGARAPRSRCALEPTMLPAAAKRLADNDH